MKEYERSENKEEVKKEVQDTPTKYKKKAKKKVVSREEWLIHEIEMVEKWIRKFGTYTNNTWIMSKIFLKKEQLSKLKQELSDINTNTNQNL